MVKCKPWMTSMKRFTVLIIHQDLSLMASIPSEEEEKPHCISNRKRKAFQLTEFSHPG